MKEQARRISERGMLQEERSANAEILGKKEPGMYKEQQEITVKRMR